MPLIGTLIGITILAAKVFVVKELALTGYRFAHNGLDWPATLDDLVRDHRFLRTAGKDAAQLAPALLKLYTSTNLESMIEAAKDIKKARAHLPEKTLVGLNKSVGLDTIINGTIAYGVTQVGRAMLKEKTNKLDTSEKLLHHYYALYLIGRSQTVLEPKEQGRAIGDLLTAHEARNNQIDQTARRLLQVWGADKASQLTAVIMNLPEVSQIQATPESFASHAVYALGGKNSPEAKTDLLTELSS